MKGGGGTAAQCPAFVSMLDTIVRWDFCGGKKGCIVRVATEPSVSLRYAREIYSNAVHPRSIADGLVPNAATGVSAAALPCPPTIVCYHHVSVEPLASVESPLEPETCCPEMRSGKRGLFTPWNSTTTQRMQTASIRGRESHDAEGKLPRFLYFVIYL